MLQSLDIPYARQGPVGLLRLQVTQIQQPGPVGVRGGRHDTAAVELVAQQIGEQERSEVVQRERSLESLGGLRLRVANIAPALFASTSTLPVALADLCSASARTSLISVRSATCSWTGGAVAHGPGLPRNRPDALSFAPHERHLRALRGASSIAAARADAARGPRDQHKRH